MSRVGSTVEDSTLEVKVKKMPMEKSNSEDSKSRKLNTLEHKGIKIVDGRDFNTKNNEKSKTIDNTSVPTPDVPKQSPPHRSIIFTHDQLCNEKLTWDQLPNDDSWSKRWTWSGSRTLSRTP